MGCKVTYVADNMDGAEPYRSQLSREGIEVIHAPYFKSVENYLRQHGAEFDVVTLCRHYIAIQHIKTVREVNPPQQSGSTQSTCVPPISASVRAGRKEEHGRSRRARLSGGDAGDRGV